MNASKKLVRDLNMNHQTFSLGTDVLKLQKTPNFNKKRNLFKKGASSFLILARFGPKKLQEGKRIEKVNEINDEIQSTVVAMK